MPSNVAADGLIAKHTELLERRHTLQGELRAVEADVEALARAIRIMDPSAAITEARPKRGRPRRAEPAPVPKFEHGEFARLAREAIRRARGPFTANVVAEAVVAAKGGEEMGYRPSDLAGKVSSTLANFMSRGAVERAGNDADGRVLYRVAA